MNFTQKSLILIVLIICGVVTLVAITPYEEPQDPYCDMMYLWEKTNGEYGWPPVEGKTCETNEE